MSFSLAGALRRRESWVVGVISAPGFGGDGERVGASQNFGLTCTLPHHRQFTPLLTPCTTYLPYSVKLSPPRLYHAMRSQCLHLLFVEHAEDNHHAVKNTRPPKNTNTTMMKFGLRTLPGFWNLKGRVRAHTAASLGTNYSQARRVLLTVAEIS